MVVVVCVPAQRQRREELEDLDAGVRGKESAKDDNVPYIPKANCSSD